MWEPLADPGDSQSFHCRNFGQISAWYWCKWDSHIHGSARWRAHKFHPNRNHQNPPVKKLCRCRNQKHQDLRNRKKSQWPGSAPAALRSESTIPGDSLSSFSIQADVRFMRSSNSIRSSIIFTSLIKIQVALYQNYTRKC